jgi:acyl dehydratase
MSQPLAAYHVQAYNTAKDSENKMHDDVVARRFGFSGGLVTGVDLLAYMMHLPVARWGRDFLERGFIEGRFLKPVYDGDDLTLAAEPDMGTLQLSLKGRGQVCASGAASLRETVPSVDLSKYPVTPPVAERRPVDEQSYAAGKWFGVAPMRYAAAEAAAYARDVRDDEALYARDGLVHPGVVQRLMNRVLVENAVLGPWIHVGSKMQLLSAIAVGEELTARARVTEAYEKKGHRFVELDAVVVANGTRAVAHCHHIAITQPRENVAG